MERVCFYWFCMTLKRKVRRNGGSTDIITFLNEVIHPIIGYKKCKVPAYPESINPTREIRDKGVREEYKKIIDISTEENKAKEMQRLFEAFSKINELCSWEIIIESKNEEIKKGVLKDKVELKKYLSESDLELLLYLSDQKGEYLSFLSFLLICLVHYIPNSITNEKTIVDKPSSFLHRLFSHEVVVDEVITYSETYLNYKVSILENNNINDFSNILFIPLDKIERFMNSNDKGTLLPSPNFINSWEYLKILLFDSICNCASVQRGFIAPNSIIDREIDRQIELSFRSYDVCPRLFIGRFHSKSICFNKLEVILRPSIKGRGANRKFITLEYSQKFLDDENSKRSELFSSSSLIRKYNDNPSLLPESMKAAKKLHNLCSLGNTYLKEWTNEQLSEGFICWVLIF